MKFIEMNCEAMKVDCKAFRVRFGRAKRVCVRIRLRCFALIVLTVYSSYCSRSEVDACFGNYAAAKTKSKQICGAGPERVTAQRIQLVGQHFGDSFVVSDQKTVIVVVLAVIHANDAATSIQY